MEPNGSLPSWRYHRVHTRSKVAEKTRTEKGKSLQFLDRANLNLCIFRNAGVFMDCIPTAQFMDTFYSVHKTAQCWIFVFLYGDFKDTLGGWIGLVDDCLLYKQWR